MKYLFSLCLSNRHLLLKLQLFRKLINDFFFCFPNAKQRYPFLIFTVIINSICFMLARPMKQKILHNVFFQQLHKGNMHIGRDYLIVITGEGIVSVAELLSITPV